MKKVEPKILSKYVDYGDSMGTSQYYTHPLFPDTPYTDGVLAFALEEEAFWLVELILSHAHKLKDERFAVIYCHVEDGSAVVFWQRDDDEPINILQHVEATDLENDAKFWLENGVLITPREH